MLIFQQSFPGIQSFGDSAFIIESDEGCLTQQQTTAGDGFGANNRNAFVRWRIQGVLSIVPTVPRCIPMPCSISCTEDRATEESGLTAVTMNTPIRKLAAQIGERNCQAEMPADRATTSSYFRLSTKRTDIEANRMMNGMVA